MLKPTLITLACAFGLAVSTTAPATTECAEDTPNQRSSYPTSTLADYVLGCMMSNGQSPAILKKCACSMDYIAAAISYEDYEKIETLISLQQMPGVGRNAAYKNAAWSKQAVSRLREVQAESTLRCF